LAGIERLYPLERLDLRDNKLTDPTELARLTGIPELKEIWVAGNPFTKTHSNYRVIIFNLFRNTPGFTEDMIIDASGPGYNERRQLVERALEREGVPVVKPAPPEFSVDDITKPNITYGPPKEVIRKERPQPMQAASETYTSTSRRRRTPKRRIVDLSTSDAAFIAPKAVIRTPAVEQTSGTAGSDSGYGVSPDHHKPLPDIPRVDTATAAAAVASKSSRATLSPSESLPSLPKLNTQSTPQLLPGHDTFDTSGLQLPHIEPQDWSVTGEAYRQKIEQLREEVGNGWLSVLSEEGWEGKKFDGQGQMSPASTIRAVGTESPTTPRVLSPPVAAVKSGRTLG
jgi:hypothetical protein